MKENSKSQKFTHAPRKRMDNLKENEPLTALVLFVILAVVILVADIFALKIPVIAAGLVLIIECGLAVCLHKVPLWLHILVVCAQIALGIFAGKVIFMILSAAIYFSAVVVLSFLNYK